LFALRQIGDPVAGFVPLGVFIGLFSPKLVRVEASSAMERRGVRMMV